MAVNVSSLKAFSSIISKSFPPKYRFSISNIIYNQLATRALLHLLLQVFHQVLTLTHYYNLNGSSITVTAWDPTTSNTESSLITSPVSSSIPIPAYEDLGNGGQ